MRTILLFLISILFTNIFYAQNVDIATLVLSPEPGYDIVEEDTFSITIGILNHGNTIIDSTDSIYLSFFIDDNLIHTQEGAQFLMRRPNNDSTAQTEIAIGDTAFQVISLAIPSAYIPLFQNDIICFTSELYSANSNTPVIEANMDNNKGCNIDIPIGIHALNNKIDVFNTGQTINITSNIKSVFTLYDLYGRPIKTEHLKHENHAIDISSLPKAVYVYKIAHQSHTIQTGKLLK